MKRFKAKLLIIAIICIIFCLVSCDGKKVDGFEFTSNGDGTCYVSGIRKELGNTVTIPEKSPAGDLVTGIKKYAFCGCDMITHITIPESVTSIGEDAFHDCFNITSITIPKSIKSIGKNAFANCLKLFEVVNNSDLNIESGSEEYGGIGFYAKDIHSGESKIDIKDGFLFYIYDGVNFLLGNEDTSENLSNLVLPDDYNGEKYEIYDGAFFSWTNLTNVTVPDGVTRIGRSAFYLCSNISHVSIGDGVESIGPFSFYCISFLKSVELGNGLTEIGEWAFDGCNMLSSVSFKDTNGWEAKDASGENVIHISSLDLSDPEKAAQYLSSTYANNLWSKE